MCLKVCLSVSQLTDQRSCWCTARIVYIFRDEHPLHVYSRTSMQIFFGVQANLRWSLANYGRLANGSPINHVCAPLRCMKDIFGTGVAAAALKSHLVAAPTIRDYVGAPYYLQCWFDVRSREVYY